MSFGRYRPEGDGWRHEDFDPDGDNFEFPPDVDAEELDHSEKMLAIGIRMSALETYFTDGILHESIYLDIGGDDDELVPVFSGATMEDVEEILSNYSIDAIDDTTVRSMTAEEILAAQKQFRHELSSIVEPQEYTNDRFWTFETEPSDQDASTVIASQLFSEFLQQERIDLTRIASVATHPEDVDFESLQGRFLEFVEGDERRADVLSHRLTILRSLNERQFSPISRNRIAVNIVIPTIKGAMDLHSLEQSFLFLEKCDEEFLVQAVHALIYNTSRLTLPRCLPFIREIPQVYGHILQRGDIDRIHALLVSTDESEQFTIPND